VKRYPDKNGCRVGYNDMACASLLILQIKWKSGMKFQCGRI